MEAHSGTSDSTVNPTWMRSINHTPPFLAGGAIPTSLILAREETKGLRLLVMVLLVVAVVVLLVVAVVVLLVVLVLVLVLVTLRQPGYKLLILKCLMM